MHFLQVLLQSVPETTNKFMELSILQYNDQLTVRFFSRKKEKSQLHMYDVNGKNVFEKNIFLNEGINYNAISCAGLAKGMYYVSVGGRLGKKVVVE
jgi:hypothetical protein